MTTQAGNGAEWTPSFSSWRHGGWYVDNVRYPSGAVGCVSRNYADRKWRIVCDPRAQSFPGGINDHTYPDRDAAARAERELAEAQGQPFARLAEAQGTADAGAAQNGRPWFVFEYDGMGRPSRPFVATDQPELYTGDALPRWTLRHTTTTQPATTAEPVTIPLNVALDLLMCMDFDRSRPAQPLKQAIDEAARRQGFSGWQDAYNRLPIPARVGT